MQNDCIRGGIYVTPI